MTPEDRAFLLFSVIKVVVVFVVLLVGVALVTLMERKVAGWMQNRPGPNRVGPSGILQPVADGLKNFIKEETHPLAATQLLFLIAPALSFIPAMMLIAVIPLAAPLQVDIETVLPLIGLIRWHGPVVMTVAEVPVGFIFILAFSSIGVYGIALAGWSSNSKYSLLGGLRASAQMISYEVAMGLSLVPVLLLTGNATFPEIIRQQQAGAWFVGPLFLSFFVFLVAGFAETNRLPFDMPEAESELVAGYHSEYSAMKFALFMLAEYAHVITIAAMIATLYFGGWDIPFTDWDMKGGLAQTLVSYCFFFAKMFFWVFFVIWIRWTLPRFRYDQLMSLGWKVLLPIALVYIMVIAGAIQGMDAIGLIGPHARSLALFGLNLILGYAVFFYLDRGHVVEGASRHARRAAAPARAEG